MDLQAGTRFGPYEIISRLGAGGMGVVYRARDSRLQRDVAIKVLQSQFATDPDRLHRFEQEARATSALNHPNILSVFDAGTWEGSPFIVSELLEGTTLRELLRASTFGGRKGVDLAGQITRGLAAAHGKGIIHRDLKPENLFITHDGRAKILDFGLAKLTGEDVAHTSQESDTRTGRILGTAGYISPEQVRGGPVDERSDIFALGAILYEMFSGKRAFREASAVETLSAVLTVDPPDPMLTNAPAGLDAVILRCLEKDPERRFQTASDLAFHLESIRESPLARGSARSRWRLSSTYRRGLGPIAITVAAAALLGAAMMVARRTAPPPSSPSYTRLTFAEGNIAEARFAPDGRTVVYGAAWNGAPMQIFTTRVDGPDSRRLDLSTGSVFSVSSRGVLAISEGCELNWGKCRGTLAQVALDGGAPRKIADDIDWADWAPDAKDLAIVRPVGGRYRLEYPIGHVLFETTGWMSTPRFSPDGQRIAFCDHPDLAAPRGSITVVDLNGKKTVLSSDWKIAFGLAWRSNDEIWFNGSRTTRTVKTMAVRLDRTERQVMSSAGDFEIVDISRQGDALYFRTNIRGHMFAVQGDVERELSWFDWSTAADISNDGKTVLFYEWGDAARGNPEVFVRSIDGSEATRLGAGRALALSPDGAWALALDSTSAPRPRLVAFRTGAGDKRVLPAGDIVEFYSATFFPDGHRILIAGEGKDRVPASYVQDIDGGAPRAIGVEGMAATLISPDGREIIAYGAAGRFYHFPVEGGALVPIEGLRDGDRLMQWSADGRAVFVRSVGDKTIDIDRVDLASGHREPWKIITPADRVGLIDVDVQGVCMTRDGKSFVYTYWKALQDLYFASNLK